MNTIDFIETIRADIKRELREEILTEIQPSIQKQLYANIFDFKEACQYLKVSEATLRRMTKLKEVPFFRQRDRVYFRQIDLEKHISGIVVKGG